MKSIIRLLAPPVVLDALQRLNRDRIRFVGDFKSWEAAKVSSVGYSAQAILDRVVQATRKVTNGEVAFERDGVTFQKMEYNFPLAWALMRAAARHGRLHVLDFGGSLGSTYFQSRQLVNSSRRLRWAIVEQPAYVEAGSKEFSNKELSFHPTIEDACKSERFDVLLLSGVIQYLPHPIGFLDYVLDRGIPSIILDRTPFMMNGIARLTVQHVPESIYPASYPAWFFSEHEFQPIFEKYYDLIATWPALDKHHPENGRAEYKGFLFELRQG